MKTANNKDHVEYDDDEDEDDDVDDTAATKAAETRHACPGRLPRK